MSGADAAQDSERWRASEEELAHRDRLAECVDTSLSRVEQETGLSFFGGSDRAQIFSYSPPVVQSLLRHAYARIEWVFVADGTGGGERRRDVGDVTPAEAQHGIEGLQATVPVGTLSVKGVPRKRDVPSGIVTTPAESEEIAEVFDS